jgi:hypothetical protein
MQGRQVSLLRLPRSFAVSAIGCVVAGLLLQFGCGLREFKNQEAKLRPLVERKATKEEALSLLGSNVVYWSRDQTNWVSLMEYLQREPPNRLTSVREKINKWPKVLFHSTPEMMTWVFLDEKERVVDFVVGAQ